MSPLSGTTALPFPLVSLEDDHPSGCPEECDFPLHLTAGALDTLARHAVPVGVVRSALDGERRAHARLRTYPAHTPPTWNARIEGALEKMGVPDAVIEAAREKGEKRSDRVGRSTIRSLAATQDRVREWKAQNKERVAAHSRAYRQRLKAVK